MVMSRLTVLVSVFAVACGSADPAFYMRHDKNGDSSSSDQYAVGVQTPESDINSSSDANASVRSPSGILSGPDGSDGGSQSEFEGEGSDEVISTNRGVALEDEQEAKAGVDREGAGREGVSEEAIDDNPIASESEKSTCAAKLGIDVKKLKIVSADSMVILDPSQLGVLIKMVGNQSSLTLHVGETGDAQSVKGVCLFQRGNQAYASVQVHGKLGSFYLNARGNQAITEMDIGDSATVAKIQADLGGNRPRFSVNDRSDSACKQLSVQQSGSDSEAECTH